MTVHLTSKKIFGEHLVYYYLFYLDFHDFKIQEGILIEVYGTPIKNYWNRLFYNQRYNLLIHIIKTEKW